MPGELADEENDPHGHHHHHHPSLSPDEVSSACFMTIEYPYLFTPNYPIKKGRTPSLKVRIWSAPYVGVYINDFGLS